MPYNDVPYLSYKLLQHRMQHMAPYRDKLTKVWPVGAREYSDRHFRYDEESGVFQLYLGHLDQVDRGVSRHGADQRDIDRAAYAHTANIYPDNTIEFLNCANLGTHMFLNNALRHAYLQQISAKGGPVYQFRKTDESHRRDGMHPVFRHLRVSLDNHRVHPTTEYVTRYPTLKRKAAKEHMKKYEEFLSVANMFLSSLNKNGILEILQDVGAEFESCKIFSDEEHRYGRTPHDISFIIESLVDQKRYADAAIMCGAYATPWGLHSHRVMVHGDQFLINNIKKFLADRNAFTYKTLRYRGEDMFEYRTIPMGDVIPSSRWKVLITVNGHAVDRLFL